MDRLIDLAIRVDDRISLRSGCQRGGFPRERVSVPRLSGGGAHAGRRSMTDGRRATPLPGQSAVPELQ